MLRDLVHKSLENRSKTLTLSATYQNPGSSAGQLIPIFDALRKEVDRLTCSEPVYLVYNPLSYAWPMFVDYLDRFVGRGQVVLVGMNPGPWGMAQTGIPFGEVSAVRDWMGLSAEIGKPPVEHPKRPVTGLQCPRSEVSGRRLWGWAQGRHSTPEKFFRSFLVLNYCPLLFLEASGRNLTPDRLRVQDRTPLFEACDRALRDAMEVLEPSLVVGVGAFGARRCGQVLAASQIQVGSILHPSPASPAANRGWAQQAEKQLLDLGVNVAFD